MLSAMLTIEQHERFITILGNAFEATVTCNPHQPDFISIREYFERQDRDGVAHEEAVRVCEESGQVWHLSWYSNSVGHYSIHAPTYEALVLQILSDTPMEMQVSYEDRK